MFYLFFYVFVQLYANIILMFQSFFHNALSHNEFYLVGALYEEFSNFSIMDKDKTRRFKQQIIQVCYNKPISL